MKNFTLALLGLLALVSYPAAEVIDTVTFNPARLGQYERLKVSDGLTSHGGVQAQSAQVQAAGTATAANEANYRIPQVQVNGSLNMPSTRFETPKLNSRGGTAYFDETAGTDIQSHIDTLTQTALRVKANVLEAQNIQVQGVPSGDYDGNTVQGLKLGGNDIPIKTTCSGLDWIPRIDADGNTYKVLGMKTCSAFTPSCLGGQEYNPDTDKCECPALPLCIGSQTKNPLTCNCECLAAGTSCPAGQTWNKNLCACVEQKTYNCLGTGVEHVFSYRAEFINPCTSMPSASGINLSYCYVNLTAAKECLGLSQTPQAGIPSGCTPGQPCEDCVVGKTYVGFDGLPDRRYVYCASGGPGKPGVSEDFSGTVYRLKTYSCYRGDAQCRKVSNVEP